MDEKEYQEILAKKRAWEDGPRKKFLEKLPYLKGSAGRFYTPLDLKDFHFLEKVGFPGTYPYTAGSYPLGSPSGLAKMSPTAIRDEGPMRAAQYSGYGTAEDTRDFYKQMIGRGIKAGPNLALDLPTQCGYDSDSPLAEGEVGKVGVAIDSLRDFEVVYEPYEGKINLDRIATNWTINAPAIYFIAMYAALAEKRGIPLNTLRGTPQNDILKEYPARGTYIFPPRPSMRLFRDTLEFLTRNCPEFNILSVCGFHMREAGATRRQDLAFTMAHAIAYIQAGLDAGLEVDAFAPHFTFLSFGGSMEFLKEVAFQRAARRMYARIMKERFGARDPRSMIIRQVRAAHTGPSNTTIQRPLNNLTRSVISGIAGALSGGSPYTGPPYDEPLGLGWSLEAQQLDIDADRILMYEARMMEVIDPFAGSYYMESLTDEMEEDAWEELNKIDEMGGAVAALEQGYQQREIARSAYEFERMVNEGEILKVGVNCFTGEHELEVKTTRLVPHPYDPEKRERAEEKQIANLKEVKRSRNGSEVKRLLQGLEKKVQRDDGNLIPPLIECAKAYVTIQEVFDVMRGVFGEYDPASAF